MSSPDRSRHYVPHKSARQMVDASRDSLIGRGLTEEEYELAKSVGHTAARTIQEAGSDDPLSELGAGGHLGIALLILALKENNGLAPGVDLAAIDQSASSIAGIVGPDATTGITRQPVELHAVADRSL